MLAHGKMEKLDFSFLLKYAQMTIASHYSTSSFIEEERTTSDALVATVNTLSQDSFTWP